MVLRDEGLVAATSAFPTFAATGDLTMRKREAAAFLANVAHETGGLFYIEEIHKAAYCSPSSACPCAAGKRCSVAALSNSAGITITAPRRRAGLALQTNPDLVAQTPPSRGRPGCGSG